MKKLSLLFVCVVLSLAASMAQKAVASFQIKEHDFGKIKEADGNATFVFDFVNKGDAPLVINRVQASCGCTTPTWTKEPIEAKKKGSITVTYAAPGRPGAFNKTITVYSNSVPEEPIVLVIKGEVLPKEVANK